MNQPSAARDFWFRHVDSMPARERVSAAVAALTRARRLQVLVDHGCGGLLAGLGLATAVVLAARLLPSPYPAWLLAGATVFVALAIALLLGWRRRPDALDAAIRADLTLNLKQRLSTAWEFMAVHGDGELAERLAVQAVRAGLPDRPESVFPLQINRWGRLAPFAAATLLLASLIDLNSTREPVPHEVDEQVASEGQRLGAFGRAMQERAKRDKLPRSARQAGEIERLGARMESGALSRDHALNELRKADESLDRERTQALAEAGQGGAGSKGAGRKVGSPNTSGLNPEAMLDRMRRGALDSADSRALSQRLDDLERSGVPRPELKSALARHQAGSDDALKEILEKLALTERALKEDRELRGAREQVRRARENLGESPARADRARDPAAGIDWDEDEDRDRGARGDAKAGADGRLESRPGRDAQRADSPGDASVAAERQHSPFSPDSGKSGPLLKPQGQMREGPVYSSQGKILPRADRPVVENVEMKSEFASQVESVLSREEYPAHYKEFIRRYFLSLSRGAPAQRESPGARGTP